MKKKTKIKHKIVAWGGSNEMARALFQRAGTASAAVAVDTRHKVWRNPKAYSRKGREARAWAAE